MITHRNPKSSFLSTPNIDLVSCVLGVFKDGMSYDVD